MPLPFIIGAAVVAAGWGAKKSIDAKNDFAKATEYQDRAKRVFEEASNKLDNSRKETNQAFENLGRTKLKVSPTLKEWVDLFKQIKHIEVQDIGIKDFNISMEKDILELKDITIKLEEIAGAGAASLTSGALAGLGAYGGAMTFGAASTGTAIGSLSGVAATNATLAWFGGGSLAAGGAGMAGGAAVLGGVVAGPVILVAGMIAASKAEKARADAYSNLKDAELKAEEINVARLMVDDMKVFASSVSSSLVKLESALLSITNMLYLIVRLSRDYRTYPPYSQSVVYQSAIIAKALKDIFSLSILTKEGSLNRADNNKLSNLLEKCSNDIASVTSKFNII